MQPSQDAGLSVPDPEFPLSRLQNNGLQRSPHAHPQNLCIRASPPVAEETSQMGLRYGLRAEIILGSELERKRGPWASGVEDGGRGHQPGSVGAPRSWKRPGARSPLEPQKEPALPAPRVWPARPFSKSRGAMRHIRGVCRHRQARGRSSQHRGRARLPRSPGSGAPGEGTPCAAWLRGVWTRGFCSRQRSGGASAFAAAGSHRHHGPAPLQMVRSTPESPSGPLGPLPARWECTPQVGVLWTGDMMRDPWASPLPSVGMGGAC